MNQPLFRAGLKRNLLSAAFASFLFLFLTSCSMFKKADTTASSEQTSEEVNSLFLDAMQDIMLDKNEAAFKKFSEVVKKQPRNATAHFQLSRLWLKKSNLKKAIAEIRLAEKYDPDNKWILDFYATLMIADRQFMKAAGLYERLIPLETDPAGPLTKRALALSWAGKYKEALAVLDKLQTIHTDFDEELQISRAQLYLKLNQMDSVLAINKSLIQFDSTNATYQILLSKLYIDAGEKEKALRQLTEFEKKHPNDVGIQSAILDFYRNEDPEKFQQYADEVFLTRNNSLEEKIMLLGAFVTNRQKGDTMAMGAFNRYLPRLAEVDSVGIAKFAYGVYLFEQRKPEEAEKYFEQVIEIDSAHLRSWGFLMELNGAREKASRLVAQSTRAREIFPDNPIFNYYNAIGHLYQEEYPGVIEASEDGLLKISKEDTFLAISFHSILGDSYQHVNKNEDAESHYRKALGYDPHNITVLNNYSYFLAVTNKSLDTALEMSEITITVRPEEATFLDTYAWVLYKKGDYKKAKKYIDKALKNATGDQNGVLYEHSGDIEWELGNRKAALEAWLKARQQGQDSEELHEKIKRDQGL